MSVQFHAQLLAESLQEAGDLFVRRCQYLNPPLSGLSQVLEVDTRLDAHLDLLFYGGAGALKLAKQTEADAGSLYAAARTMIRLGQWEAWQSLADVVASAEDDPDRLQAGDPDVMMAMAAAAAHEPWTGALDGIEAALAAGGDDTLLPSLAHAAGYHRWDLVPALTAGLTVGVKAPAVWLWALGQIDEARARATVLPFLESPDADVARAAASALCRTEDDQVAHWLAAQARNQLWAPVVLAFLGGPGAAQSLALHIETGDAYAICAAGLLGDGALVPVLLRALENPDLAPNAAQALHLVSGCAPMEAEPPTATEGDDAEDDPAPPPTEWRLAQSQTEWTQALSGAGLQFSPAVRYRLGAPASPLQSILALRSPQLRQDLRALVIDELYVRFGLGVHLRADQHAARQLRVLFKLEQFLPQMASPTPPGAFSFQGRRGVG